MYLPNAKFIISVRNPIERAFSAYSYFLTITDVSRKPWKDFEEALEADPSFLERGRYIEQIEVIHQHIDPKNLLILFYDDLNSDENRYWKSMLEFLGLDASVPCQQIGQRRNSLKGAGFLKKFDRFGMKPARKWLQGTGAYASLRKVAKGLTAENYDRAITPSTRSRLIEYFRPYNERLSGLTGRSLEHWNR
jgi:3',5'-cyclic AMP phosphodiesterase CpdA